MIEVELYDGTVLEFPEGTDPAVIDRVARSETLARRGPAMSANQIVPPMAMPRNPELVTAGPGPTGRIDPALYEQGILPRRYQEQVAPTTSIGGDVSKAIAANLTQGVSNLVDLPGQVVTGLGGLAADGMGLLGLPPDYVSEVKRSLEFTPLGTGSTARDAASMATGGQSEYEGESRLAKIAGNAAEFAPAALLGPGNKLLNLINFGLVPGAASELAGQATEGKTIPEGVPVIGGMDAEPLARATTAIFSPMVATTLENAALRAITPNPADPRFTEAARKMAQEGVDLTAGQKVDNANLRYIEDTRPRTQRIVKNQLDQFTRATLKRIGVEADGATPDIMNEAGRKIGAEFNALARRNVIPPDATMAQGAADVVAAYARNTSRLNIVPRIKDVATKIDDAVSSGKGISGRQYQEWRSDLSKLSAKGDTPSVKEAARNLVNVLDDAMERSIAATGSRDDIAAYKAVRSKWRDYLAIADAVDGAGQNAALGVVTPQNLGGAVRAQDDMAYVTGRRDLGELARAGTVTMPTLPNSGSIPRLSALAGPILAGTGGAGAVASMTYGLTGNPTIAGLVGGASAMLPLARNALSATAPMQAYLSNQLATGSVPYNPGGLLGPVANTISQR